MTTETIRPDADTSAGLWTPSTGGSLFAMIDEAIADNADYIKSGLNPANDITKIRLSNPTGVLTTPISVDTRYKKEVNNATAVNLKVRLLQGTTEIASWTYTGISSSFADASEPLTAPQIAAITDFNDLFIEFTANPASGLWTPANLLGTAEEPYGWYDATDGTFMTLATADITQMTDRNGDGRHLSTTGGTFIKPTYASSMVDVGPSLNAGAFNAWAVAMPAATWDLFFVGDPIADGVTRTLVSDAAGNGIIYVNGAGDFKLWDGGNERSCGVAWGGTGKRQAVIEMRSTSDIRVGINDATAVAYTLGGAITSSFTAPILFNGISGVQPFGGQHEWLFLPTGTSAPTRAKIQGYLAWKWDTKLGGTTFVTALDAGHAYKSAAPTA